MHTFNHMDWIFFHVLDEFHKLCLEEGYLDVDADGLPHYPTNGNGHIYPEVPQIPQIPQVPQIPQIPQIPYIPHVPHISIDGHGNGNGQRPQGPVGELKNWVLWNKF